MGSLLSISKRLAEIAEDRAASMNVSVSITVVDIHGNLVFTERMTGAPLVSLEMSHRKAYTAALLRMTTQEVAALAQPGKPLDTITSVAGGRFVTFGGGAPLLVDGEIVAGAGVSGGTVEQDTEIIDSAVAALLNDAGGR